MLFMRDDHELVTTHAWLIRCADNHGLLLKKLYVHSGGSPDTILHLLGTLLEFDGVPLVVPSLHHLWTLGHPLHVRDHLQHIGHDVMTAYKPAERAC
ncbi:hypothetical protein ACFV9C_23770 [Kribbella sp. NPDC059898]|uniref:hypothetical protein n=1 Tax=Kribbella sp. NPDC059898 TaxID=3346995 RepID=UPI0036671D1A